MAADYTPYVSEYREASVLEVGADGRLTLQLIGESLIGEVLARHW